MKIGKLLTKVTLTHMSRSSPSYCNVTQSCFFFFFSKNISFVLRCDSMEPKNVDRHMRVVVMAPSSRQPSTHRPLSLVASVSHSCIRIKKPSSAVVIENNFGFFYMFMMNAPKWKWNCHKFLLFEFLLFVNRRSLASLQKLYMTVQNRIQLLYTMFGQQFVGVSIRSGVHFHRGDVVVMLH